MKLTSLVGTSLIVIGVIALALQGISYTTQEKIVDLGPIQATAESRETLPLPPLLGGVTLAAGVLLLIAGPRKT